MRLLVLGKRLLLYELLLCCGQKTVVIVPTVELRKQWVKEIEDKLGISEKDVGIIQGSKNTSKGKAISIAILHTLAKRDNEDYFNDTGFVILDESHRVSTEYFSQVIPKFKAQYRLGLTATPKRKDNSDVVLYNQFGQPKVIANTKVMPVTLVIKEVYNNSVWGETDREMISSLVRSKTRNLILRDLIVKAYNSGRTVLGVTNSVKHAQALLKLLQNKIPEDDLGQFTATKIVDNKSKKMSNVELELAKTKRVIIATDGIIREGVDIPDIDCGIDLIPFYNATQRVGRARRFKEGKKTPYWLTILDKDREGNNIIPLHIMYKSRYKEYEEQRFTIKVL